MDAETKKKVFCCLLPSVIIISLIVLVHSIKVGLPSHVLMVWPCNIIVQTLNMTLLPHVPHTTMPLFSTYLATLS